MYKIILMTLLLGITAFAQDNKEPDVPLWMADNKIVIKNNEKKKLSLDFSGEAMKIEYGGLEPKEAFKILQTTIGTELNSLRFAVDSLRIVNSYLETKLRSK